ncbi:MAG TPA: ATP-binding protein [Coriobacteriia bacterium]
MATGYVQRTIEPLLRRSAAEFPAVTLTGPRQSGKTTLLRRVFGESHQYVSLADPEVRAWALGDPRDFLARHPAPVILDEVTYAPDLLHYVMGLIDSDRSAKGCFILSGSQNLGLVAAVSESLAGRTDVLRLFPLTDRELDRDPGRSLFWDRDPLVAREALAAPVRDAWGRFLQGYYPEVALDTHRDAYRWHAAYATTYLEQDVRSLRAVGDLAGFQSFMQLLAARTATVLDLTALSRDLGVAVNTIKGWLSVLEATHQVFFLRPDAFNASRRMVKRPKLYFLDIGTVCYLTGLRDVEHAARGPMAGQIVETAVVAEVYKAYAHLGLTPALSFWQTAHGVEVDLVIRDAGRVVPVEVKSAGTANRRWADGVRTFRSLETQGVPDAGYVVHPGDTAIGLGDGVLALPLREL